MRSLLALAALLTLGVPMMAVADASAQSGRPATSPAFNPAAAPQCDSAGLNADAVPVPVGTNPLSAFRSTATARQVRIEQRVVVRIAPRVPSARQNLTADLPQRELSSRFEERGKEKCVALQGIAGVQTGSGNRLVLFLRDRRMISVNLEKSCRARDFYSGFYVEKSKDGRLCVDRDRLQSRTGVSCEVETMRRLVEAND